MKKLNFTGSPRMQFRLAICRPPYRGLEIVLLSRIRAVGSANAYRKCYPCLKRCEFGRFLRSRGTAGKFLLDYKNLMGLITYGASIGRFLPRILQS